MQRGKNAQGGRSYIPDGYHGMFSNLDNFEDGLAELDLGLYWKREDREI